MSRIVEILLVPENFNQEQDGIYFRTLIKVLLEKLETDHVQVHANFKYGIPGWAPITGKVSRYTASCRISVRGWSKRGRILYKYALAVDTTVMTVCPCSLATTEGRAAHVQRCYLGCNIAMGDVVHYERIWIEDIARLLRASGSAPVHSLLKREDEAELCMQAFDNPKFVEDVVRDACGDAVLAFGRDTHNVETIEITARSKESIHPYDVMCSVLWPHDLATEEFIEDINQLKQRVEEILGRETDKSQAETQAKEEEKEAEEGGEGEIDPEAT